MIHGAAIQGRGFIIGTTGHVDGFGVAGTGYAPAHRSTGLGGEAAVVVGIAAGGGHVGSATGVVYVGQARRATNA